MTRDILSTLKSVAQGRILLAYVTRAMLDARGAPDDELSNLAAEIRASENAAVVFLLGNASVEIPHLFIQGFIRLGSHERICPP